MGFQILQGNIILYNTSKLLNLLHNFVIYYICLNKTKVISHIIILIALKLISRETNLH